MTTTIVKCLDNTYDLVMVSDDKTKGVRKNYLSQDLITSDEELVLIAAFIHLLPNQWLQLIN